MENIGFFRIEKGSPKVNTNIAGFAEDIGEAIQIAFPLETEDAMLHWGERKVPISYKYDLSVILEDVVGMLEWCKRSSSTSLDVDFGSDTFAAEWHLERQRDSLSITVLWRSVSGDHEEELNQYGPVLIQCSRFVNEWNAVLRVALSGVEGLALRIRDRSLLERVRKLMRDEE
jgi:hypothetical protein